MSEHENLEIVFADWLDAHRRGDIDALAARLDPDAVHQGVRPELVCRGADAILVQARGRMGHRPRVTQLALMARGDRVLLGIAGPDLRGPDGTRPPDRMGYVVFTLRDGRIVRMDDFEGRDEAIAALGGAG
jgi:ketosteroid isomerase-like protein